MIRLTLNSTMLTLFHEYYSLNIARHESIQQTYSVKKEQDNYGKDGVFVKPVQTVDHRGCLPLLSSELVV